MCSFTLVVALTAVGTVFRRWFDGAPWLFPALSPIAFPWYLLSGLPYALASRRGLTTFLVTMPLAAAAIDGVDNALNAVCLLASLLTAALAADVVHSLRRLTPRAA
jgi:TRAP-type C4-dicarboxylate transport system permease small subunit